MHQGLVECQIVPGQEHGTEHFSGTEKMMEIGSAVFRATWTRTARVQRAGIVCKACIAEVENARRRVGARRASGPGWDHTIEHVDATLNGAENVLWCPYTH